MESLSQEHDDQELLDRQLHDTLFSHINDVPSSERGTLPQEQTLSDGDLFFPGDDMMDDPPAAADESTRRMGFDMSASPAPSKMAQTTPAAAHVETPSMRYAPSASPAPASMTPTTPAGQVLSPSRTQHTIPPSEMAFLRAQTADQPRIPWQWSSTGKKVSSPYKPTAVGKWWYDYWIDSQSDPKIESAASHVGRIMETELGLQLLGDKRCTRCRVEGTECWIYSERGRKQVRHPGSACAHCRAMGPMAQGCSVATRSKSKRVDNRQFQQSRGQRREILPMEPNSSSPVHE